jgi:tRNA (guanine26-N2/guanine27-N2)-dimethyltransferase
MVTIKKKKEIIQKFSNYGYIIHCINCGYRSSFSEDILQIHQSCPVCKEQRNLRYSGPLWIGELHEEIFLKHILSTNKKKNYLNKNIIDKKIRYAIEEICMPPYYYNIHKLCQELKSPFVPKIDEVIAIIKENGFSISRTHFDYLAIKTNANSAELKKILESLIKNKKSTSKDG